MEKKKDNIINQDHSALKGGQQNEGVHKKKKENFEAEGVKKKHRE